MNDLKIKKTDFSLNREKKPSTGAKPSFNGPVAKSSYELPIEKHQALRVLSARTNKKLNVLFEEAIDDLLSKYGE